MRYGILLATLLLHAAGAGAQAVKIERNSPALEFDYGYPREAAAIPQLKRRFQNELAAAYRQALKLGVQDQQMYKEQKREGVHDFYSMQWTTAGQSPRLLSLQNQLSTFTGGAHPNTSYGALLWDRSLDRAVSVDSLFLKAGAFPALTRAGYCTALNAERAKRREGEKLDLPDFNACPKYGDLAIAPMDTNKNGRFDRIAFVASPYTAGPYAEGAYEIILPVTSQLIAAVKPSYRTAFERQRQ